MGKADTVRTNLSSLAIALIAVVAATAAVGSALVYLCTGILGLVTQAAAAAVVLPAACISMVLVKASASHSVERAFLAMLLAGPTRVVASLIGAGVLAVVLEVAITALFVWTLVFHAAARVVECIWFARSLRRSAVPGGPPGAMYRCDHDGLSIGEEVLY